MHLRNLSFATRTFLVLSLTSGLATAQSAARSGKAPSEGAVTSSYKSSNYKAPKTPDGHVDLQGVWANNLATPLERPKEFADREFLTAQELTAIKKQADELLRTNSDAAFATQIFMAALANLQGKDKGFVSPDGKTGDYGQVWAVSPDWTNRTSLIIDPKDGKRPEMTSRAKELAAKPSYVEGGAYGSTNGKRPDSYEDLGLSLNCITFGAPRIGAGYNSYMQIFQNEKTVVIQQEMIHDARIIPVDGSPHPPASVKFWLGDSRGHWEGDTLVIDTTNYREGAQTNNTEQLHVVERLQRTAPNYITWTVTFDDPGTWVKPWTVEIALRHSDDAMYEYACHEGNYALAGILAGARAADAEEASGKSASGLK